MLAKQGAVYHFRRRVPDRLRPIIRKRELWYSLRTSDRRQAKARAAALWAWTERIFMEAGGSSVTKDIDSLLKQAQQILERGEDGTAILLQLEQAIEVEAAQVDAAKARAAAAESRLSEVQFAAAAVGREEAALADTKATLARSMTVLTDLKARYEEAHTGRRTAESIAKGLVDALGRGVGAPPVPKESPVFAALQQEFLAEKSEKTEDHSGYSPQTKKQAEVGFRLWEEFAGDRPVREYSRAEAGDFIKVLKKLPGTHGKSRTHVPLGEAIKLAEEKRSAGQTIPGLTLKTIKRHFSALSQYWIWLRQRGHVDENIFSGFTFPGTKSSKKKRDIWSAEDLERLIRAEWFGADRKSSYYWMPLVGLFSGMRLEEIARLRPQHDVVEVDGIWVFELQDHPDGWSPKTEAGERTVPVHSALIELGFIDFVKQRRRQNAERVFGDLQPGGPDQKYGYRFSREFSKRKIALGVGKKTCFHSFRHTVRDYLESEDLEERWIDGVLGHERPQASEGARTYKKSLRVARAKEVIEAFKAPVDVVGVLKTVS